MHPGLDFLKDSPEFQDWYALCVINRMFFMANKKKDMKMSYREFKNSNIMKSLFDIHAIWCKLSPSMFISKLLKEPIRLYVM